MYAWVFLMGLSAAGPQMDVERICRPPDSHATPEDKANSHENCVREETEARKMVLQSWKQFPANVRSDCTFPSEVSESYVELLTCIQLESGQGFGDPAKKAAPPAPAGSAAGTKSQ